MYCVNIFLLGVFFCLLMKWEGNFWITCGIHTAWNYTQSYIMGATSGDHFSGIIGGKANSNMYFFDEIYGFQGAISTTVLITILILILIFLINRRETGTVFARDI